MNLIDNIMSDVESIYSCEILEKKTTHCKREYAHKDEAKGNNVIDIFYTAVFTGSGSWTCAVAVTGSALVKLSYRDNFAESLITNSLEAKKYATMTGLNPVIDNICFSVSKKIEDLLENLRMDVYDIYSFTNKCPVGTVGSTTHVNDYEYDIDDKTNLVQVIFTRIQNRITTCGVALTGSAEVKLYYRDVAAEDSIKKAIREKTFLAMTGVFPIVRTVTFTAHPKAVELAQYVLFCHSDKGSEIAKLPHDVVPVIAGNITTR